MFREIPGWHCLSIYSDRPSSERTSKINRENKELEAIENDELAQRGCARRGNKSRSSDNMGSIRTLDSCNMTPMQWMLIETRRKDRP